MDCKQIRIHLTDFTDGRLGADLNFRIKTHCDNCSGCRELALRLMEMQQFISSEKETRPDPYMFTRILAVMQQREAVRPAPFYALLLKPVAFVIVVLLTIFAGIGIGRNYANQVAVSRDYDTELYYLSDIHENGYESELTEE